MKWIAVVTRVNARIFRNGSFELVKELKNSEGRKKNRDLVSDKPGLDKSRYAGRFYPHSMTGEKDPHEESAVDFAKEVDEFLRKEMNRNQFDQLVVAAEPKMMGRLKSSMDKQLLKRTQWVPKDFGKLKTHELSDALGEA